MIIDRIKKILGIVSPAKMHFDAMTELVNIAKDGIEDGLKNDHNRQLLKQIEEENENE